MTIYIAGKMTGEPNCNREQFFTKESELVKQGWRVLNPAKIGDLPEYSMYWPINKAMLDGADAIYMLEGWTSSVGAKKEYGYANSLNLKIFYEVRYDRK